MIWAHSVRNIVLLKYIKIVAKRIYDTFPSGHVEMRNLNVFVAFAFSAPVA